jgi:two-component sensor histidine kinase
VKAASHPQQAARLSALRSYHILDTPREADFDELVELASAICETPISVVNLIDADRQWFKAETGLGVRETPLDTSICAHAILEKDFVEINDTILDSRMAGNELVTGDPGMRFYAGALLRTEEGLPLGTLCVLDYTPRVLSALQKRALQVLAHQVMTQLDLRRGLRTQMVLTNEIDHRVKNSLQSVSSLVQLQRVKSRDENVRAALDEVASRLRTISLVHEELHHASASDVVDLGSYLARLGSLLQNNAPGNVTFTVKSEPLVIRSRHASAIGMIVSEFSANSLKHAFPDGREGVVGVSLRRLVGGMIELVCEDNGVGAASAAGAVERRGLGLRIIEASVAQIGARSERQDADPGVRLRVVFAPDDPGLKLPG